MSCKQYKLLSSAHVDSRVNNPELAELRSHLDQCDNCRLEVDQMERISALLKSAASPAVPRELHGYVMEAARRRALHEISPFQLALEWLLKFNPKVVSYAAGLTVSFGLFAGTMAGFKPIPVISPVTETLASVEVITGSDMEYHTYNDLSPNTRAAEDDHFYELPRVMTNGSLVSFSHIAYQKPGAEAAAALVEVNSSGQSRIVEVLGKPTDPMLIQVLRWSLSKRPFEPAKRVGSGQPLPTRIVLMVQKMDVIG